MTTPTPDNDREHADAERRKAVALFRYGVIADLIHTERGQRGPYAKLREKSAQEWDIPGTLRRRVQAETMRGWLADYRRGGFDALLPKLRSDAGAARAIPQPIADLLCEKHIQVARRVDVYANCFVKRNHATKALQPSKPADLPQNAMRLSDFEGEKDASRDRDASADDKEFF
jgi:transposase